MMWYFQCQTSGNQLFYIDLIPKTTTRKFTTSKHFNIQALTSKSRIRKNEQFLNAAGANGKGTPDPTVIGNIDVWNVPKTIQQKNALKPTKPLPPAHCAPVLILLITRAVKLTRKSETEGFQPLEINKQHKLNEFQTPRTSPTHLQSRANNAAIMTNDSCTQRW